jgi:hypothetical protein
MEIVTTRCKDFNHPEFRLQYDESRALPEWADWLVEYLEGQVAAGTKFADAETIQVGWLLLFVQKNADGTLSLREPEVGTLPIAWTDAVTSTVQHVHLQKYAADSVGMSDKMIFPSFQEDAIVCNKLAQTAAYLAYREVTPEHDDSGWVIFCGEEHDHSADNLQAISLYECICQKPDLIPFLALPPGISVVVIEGALFEVKFEGQPLPIIPGSYLDAKLKQMAGEA